PATGTQWTVVPTECTVTDSGNACSHNAPDKVAPVTTIACNGSTCAGAPYWAPVNVSLSASDTGGSGLDKTYYTTDGSAPTTSSSVYNGAFQVAQTSTVKFFSTDNAGNAEQVQS